MPVMQQLNLPKEWYQVIIIIEMITGSMTQTYLGK